VYWLPPPPPPPAGVHRRLDGPSPERLALRQAFAAIVRLRLRLVLRRLGLNLVTYFWDYAGTVVNYLILAAAVVAGIWSTHAEVIVAIAKGSGFTLMVIYGFSQIVDVASQVSELAGYTARIAAFVDVSEQVASACDGAPVAPLNGPDRLPAQLTGGSSTDKQQHAPARDTVCVAQPTKRRSAGAACASWRG
jgi:hypothetical protein